MNHATFLGYLAYTPELKQSTTGTTYLRNTIRVRSPRKNEAGKVIYDEIPFTAFGQTAEQISKYIHRGSPLIVSGSMSSNTYELTVKDGNALVSRKITSISLTVNEFEFVPRDTKTTSASNEMSNGINNVSNPYIAPNGLPY